MMPVGHVFCEAPWGRRDYHIRHVKDVTYLGKEVMRFTNDVMRCSNTFNESNRVRREKNVYDSQDFGSGYVDYCAFGSMRTE